MRKQELWKQKEKKIQTIFYVHKNKEGHALSKPPAYLKMQYQD